MYEIKVGLFISPAIILNARAKDITAKGAGAATQTLQRSFDEAMKKRGLRSREELTRRRHSCALL
jgi:hypothetical protein